MFILALLILHAMYNGLPESVKNLHTKMPWRHKHKSSDLVFLILSSFFLFFPFHYYIPSFVSAYYSFLSQSLLSSLSPSIYLLLFFSLSLLPPHTPHSQSRVRPTRTGTPQRMTLSLWRTWTSWVDRRSCRQRQSWHWLWPNPWPKCRWRWRNRIARSHLWLTWSVPDLHSYTTRICVNGMALGTRVL